MTYPLFVSHSVVTSGTSLRISYLYAIWYLTTYPLYVWHLVSHYISSILYGIWYLTTYLVFVWHPVSHYISSICMVSPYVSSIHMTCIGPSISGISLHIQYLYGIWYLTTCPLYVWHPVCVWYRPMYLVFV